MSISLKEGYLFYGAFMLQEPFLTRKTSRIAREGAITAYDPVTGDKYPQGIFPVGSGDSTNSFFISYISGQLEVTQSSTERNVIQFLPYPFLK